MTATKTPLTGPPPAEVPLEHTPLVRVIAQVRFPIIASLEKRDFIAPFQEALRSDYPVLRPEQSRGVVFGPQGVVDTQSNNIWRFSDVSGGWQLSLAPDFLVLETTRYTSRDDFFGRFEQALEALHDHMDPKIIDRLGVRYIDRVVGENLRDLPQLVQPEVAGIMASRLGEQTRHAISENVFIVPDSDARLMARWGLVPAQATVDPAAIDPIEEPSWLLDLDSVNPETQLFDVGTVVSQARGLAERIYSFFRWVVTDEFLRRYGGEP